jgi:hypothetical protein
VLYKVFRYSKIAVFAAWRLGNSTELTSSAFNVETKLSAMALSKALLVLPNEGVMLTSLRLSEKERAVYRTPWSE